VKRLKELEHENSRLQRLYADLSGVSGAEGCPRNKALTGCGKTISAQQNFGGPHVWDKRRTLPQDR
jgi:hypothetical protein